MVLGTAGKVLLPWEILQCHSENSTIRDFFCNQVLPRVHGSDIDTTQIEVKNTALLYVYIFKHAYIYIQIADVFVGTTRDKLLDRVDADMCLAPVVIQFGKFMKLIVTIDTEILPAVNTSQGASSAFDVMFSAMREQSKSKVPSLVQERHGKDKLYNAIVKNLTQRGLQWRADEVNCSGINFVKSLCETLWYIDNHHATFFARGCEIPACFAQFQGYNMPELSKHRKRTSGNMSGDILQALSQKVFRLVQANYFLRDEWEVMRRECETLAHSLQKYADILLEKNKYMKVVHSSTTPWRSVTKGLDLFYLKPTDKLPYELTKINQAVAEIDFYNKIDLHPLLPTNPKKRYLIIKALKEQGLEVPSVLCVYSAGNNCGNSYFLWQVRVPADAFSLDEAFSSSQPIVEEIKKDLHFFHTRAMRAEFVQKFGRITSAVKPAVLRYFYKDLTGDSSCSDTHAQEEIDSRVKQAIEMEDPDILLDLRQHNKGQCSKYDTFWAECDKLLLESMSTAVDDRRHSHITHMATAISVRDLRDQVAARCPEGTSIPSLEWIRLQFWPKNDHAKRALAHTGRFKVRFKVQQRQFRKDHVDSHYAAALFRYQREYAVLFKDHSMFYCIDDKHRIKVGEPGFPVAAAERGRQVLQASGSRFLVGDHDFTKFGLIPSVALQITIPDDISGSWYSGKVNIGLKESAFEPSSPLRHACELNQLIATAESDRKPILFLYSDGGPDHRLTYVSVQVSLIALFLSLDLDYLCAARTAPFHSWRNPVERIMSVVNLGLQCVGLARKEMSDEHERLILNAGSLKEIRKVAEKHPSLKEATADSIASVKIRLTQLFCRLQLKGEPFKVFNAATKEEIDAFWSAMSSVDTAVTPTATKESLRALPQLQKFIDHCCRKRHYSFEIRKCGSRDCNMCKPIRLPLEVFSQLKQLPDPMPGKDQHYLPFQDVFGHPTSEEHRPSFNSKKQKKTLPFTASVQHVKNCDMMLMCEECEMWRLLYSKKKLKPEHRRLLSLKLDELSFTCGASLQDIDLPPPLNEVYVRSLSCFDPIEKLYFSAGYEPICFYCAGQVEQEQSQATAFGPAQRYYPQCVHCITKPKVSRK